MRNLTLNPPTLAFIVGTRALLAAGVGMLLAGRFGDARRQRLGRTLVALGAVTTVPALMAMRRGARRSQDPLIYHDDRLKGASRFARKGDDELSE